MEEKKGDGSRFKSQEETITKRDAAREVIANLKINLLDVIVLSAVGFVGLIKIEGLLMVISAYGVWRISKVNKRLHNLKKKYGV